MTYIYLQLLQKPASVVVLKSLYTYSIYWPIFQNNLGKVASERNHSGF